MKRPSLSIRGALRLARSAWVGIVIGPSLAGPRAPVLSEAEGSRPAHDLADRASRTRSPEEAGLEARGPARRLLVEPERVEAHHVVDAEVLLRIVALHVVVPAVVDLLPGDRQEWRVLFHDHLGLADVLQALLGIDLAVDLRQQSGELRIIPLRVVLRSALLVPGVEVV